jgi:hypothetical protein
MHLHNRNYYLKTRLGDSSYFVNVDESDQSQLIKKLLYGPTCSCIRLTVHLAIGVLFRQTLIIPNSIIQFTVEYYIV